MVLYTVLCFDTHEHATCLKGSVSLLLLLLLLPQMSPTSKPFLDIPAL